MIAESDLQLAPIEELQDIHGVPFPEEPKFRQFLITGPPGAGKSTLVGRMRGWPYEGYVDLSVPNWWRVQTLTFRPREIHLGAPFKGRQDALSVLDDEWVENCGNLAIDFRRIMIPPEKTWFFSTDWRSRYVFEFILPPNDKVYAHRIVRAKTGLFPRDRHITPEIVDRQAAFYRSIAWYFWRSGMYVYVRTDHDGTPMKIVKCLREPAL
ncbi:MAG: serine/threonine protein phosphatase [Alphaproteobacteria bacterium]|nr:serine/threonine protein phosphatase [Alphaproteobacteria bacterium]